MLKQGDCLELMKELEPGAIDMILTDLPYGLTNCAFDKRLPFGPLWEQFWRVCKPNAAVVLFSCAKFTIELAASQLNYYRYEWIWYKNLVAGFLNSKKMPLRVHENILVFYKKLPTYNPQFTQGKPYVHHTRDGYGANYGKKKPTLTVNDSGKRYPVDILKYGVPQLVEAKALSPQQKPVALLEYLIKTYTNEGETVLDATMGSGSTGVACVNTGRRFIGFELDEHYYNVAEKRINRALDGLF